MSHCFILFKEESINQSINNKMNERQIHQEVLDYQKFIVLDLSCLNDIREIIGKKGAVDNHAKSTLKKIVKRLRKPDLSISYPTSEDVVVQPQQEECILPENTNSNTTLSITNTSSSSSSSSSKPKSSKKRKVEEVTRVCNTCEKEYPIDFYYTHRANNTLEPSTRKKCKNCRAQEAKESREAKKRKINHDI